MTNTIYFHSVFRSDDDSISSSSSSSVQNSEIGEESAVLSTKAPSLYSLIGKTFLACARSAIYTYYMVSEFSEDINELANGLQEFEAKHRELEAIGKQLQNLKNTVKSKVVAAKTQGLVCTPDVVRWLQDVESRERRLNEILDEESLLLQRSCVGACSPYGGWNSQKFLSKVTSEISLVKDLMVRGNFA